MGKKITIKTLVKEVASREGKKSQVHVGNIREILGILSDLFYEFDATPITIELYKNGERRAKKRAKFLGDE